MVPLQLELKPNKHGIEYVDRKTARLKERQKTLLKYSDELSSSFMNIKKHEFLVRKLRKKLQACSSYLER